MTLILSANHLLKRKALIKMTNFIIEKRKINKKKNAKESKGRKNSKREKHKFGLRRSLLPPKNQLNQKIIHIVILHL